MVLPNKLTSPLNQYTMLTKLLKFGLPLLLIGGFVAYQMAQPKGPLDIQAAATELTINASSLYAAFETDEATANGTYAGKVIEVSGTLSAIEQDEAGNYALNLAAGSDLGQVVCNLNHQSTQPALGTTIGESVTVKGVVTGYLFDVVLDNAMLVAK